MWRRRAFFDLMDMLVLLAIAVLLISILLPSLSRARELAKRSVCAANLGGNGKAIAIYANVSRGSYPQSTRARFPSSTAGATGEAAQTGDGRVLMFDYAHSPIPGATDGLHRWQGIVDAGYKGSVKYPHVRIENKDADCAFPSRELFLLVRQSLAQPSQFVCPTTGHAEDPLWADRPGHAIPRDLGVSATEVVPAAQIWDFLEPQYLDYSYLFSHDADGERASEAIDPMAPVMADSNPYIRAALNGMKSPQASNRRNSPNHYGDGQNVMYADAHVQWCDEPTAGIGGDNIYTTGTSGPARDSGTDVPGTAPTTAAGAAGDPPTNYLFDIVSRTDTLLIP